MLVRTLILTLLLACTAPAQIALGLKIGAPLQENDSGNLELRNDRFLIGPTAELRLPGLPLSVEGAALFSRYNVRTTLGNGLRSQDGTRVELPIVGKLRLGSGLGRPYVLAGPVFGFATQDVDDSGNRFRGSRTGFTAGAGLEFRLPIFRVSPEFRYIRNRAGSLSDNTAQVLLGVSF